MAKKRRPFWLIDGKLRESDFFLERLRATSDLDEARFYFSAFMSAARTVTYALQVCLKRAPGFVDWYAVKRERLEADPLARYFHCARNTSVHIGLNPLGHQTRDMVGRSEFFLEGDKIPERNVVVAAGSYMALLVTIVGEAFSQFWSFLDLSTELTVSMLSKDGSSVEDIEQEFGLPAGWSAGAGRSEEARLELMKQYSRTEIENLHRKYGAG